MTQKPPTVLPRIARKQLRNNDLLKKLLPAMEAAQPTVAPSKPHEPSAGRYFPPGKEDTTSARSGNNGQGHYLKSGTAAAGPTLNLEELQRET